MLEPLRRDKCVCEAVVCKGGCCLQMPGHDIAAPGQEEAQAVAVLQFALRRSRAFLQ